MLFPVNQYSVIPLSLTEGTGPAEERIAFLTCTVETATAAGNGNMSVLNFFW